MTEPVPTDSPDAEAKARADRKRSRREWVTRHAVALARRGPVGVQLVGGAAIVSGVGMLLGLAAALIIGGVMLVVLGTLREAKVI